MRRLRLALAQINSTVGDIKGNSAAIAARMAEAKDRGAHIVAFPEMAMAGYPAEDLLLNPAFTRACERALKDLARNARGIIAVVGFPERDGDVYNAAAIMADGKVIAIARKHFLPSYGVFDEDRTFRKGSDVLVAHLNDFALSVNICEDLWYPEGPTRTAAVEGGASLVINISASPYTMGKARYREAMAKVRAGDHGAIVALVNLVGGQDELIFDGGSFICSPDGGVIARAPSFKEYLLVADLDLEHVVRRRLKDPRLRKARHETPQALPSLKHVDLPLPLAQPDEVLEPVLVEPPGEEEEVYAALVLGVRDYVVKNGFRRVLIGISGGIDSALTAAIAVDALGPEKVLGVTMPSRYSSEGTLSDSQRLADALGFELWTVPIEGPFQAFLETLAPHLGDRPPDVTEENLQARIRGNILMAISNKLGPLVLSTGNKSEISMGYCTLYGDMVGGFAVLKDLPKTLVYRLSRYLNRETERIPRSIIERAPSAELKEDQTDQDTLPPYDQLDVALKAYVEEDRDGEAMMALGLERSVVEQVIRTVDRNEYKRRQGPIGIKITARAFGKERRFPITNRFNPLDE